MFLNMRGSETTQRFNHSKRAASRVKTYKVCEKDSKTMNQKHLETQKDFQKHHWMSESFKMMIASLKKNATAENKRIFAQKI